MPCAYVMCVVSAMIEIFFTLSRFSQGKYCKTSDLANVAFFSFLSRLKNVRAVQIYYFLFVDFCATSSVMKFLQKFVNLN